ncbi:MAG: class I SAM-dependent methyltransferase [Armatimonadetes bacterium]|nr:class I SAM-dependent methyltransferase [Armatimonadota bacterium]
MTRGLTEVYLRDQRVWDSCALVYEDRIVGGHPDVTAYECFEEDLLDRVLLYLARECGRTVRLYDVGCGSGRLHLRYGMKIADAASLSPPESDRVRAARHGNPAYMFDPLLAERLVSVGGVDFSAQMLDIAREKLQAAGLSHLLGSRLTFDQGSAFDLAPMDAEPLPLVVCVCNSIGVMQGRAGAVELFKSVRRAIEKAGGIAVISAYRLDAVESFALGNYESTMDVCGQPRWLVPDTYASDSFLQVPRDYKRAYDTGSSIVVDVYNGEFSTGKSGHVLKRDSKAVQIVVETGHIQTYSDYESYWYSFDQFEEWTSDYWPADESYHIAGADLDSLRAEPVQLAILDPTGLLRQLMNRWKFQAVENRGSGE